MHVIKRYICKHRFACVANPNLDTVRGAPSIGRKREEQADRPEGSYCRVLNREMKFKQRFDSVFGIRPIIDHDLRCPDMVYMKLRKLPQTTRPAIEESNVAIHMHMRTIAVYIYTECSDGGGHLVEVPHNAMKPSSIQRS